MVNTQNVQPQEYVKTINVRIRDNTVVTANICLILDNLRALISVQDI